MILFSFPPIRLSFRLIPCLICAALSTACGSARGPAPDAGLGRADPAYVQWLERQSMLRAAPELTAIVSGSSLAWNAPSTIRDAAALLNRADIWLDFRHSRAARSGNAAALVALRGSGLLSVLPTLGIRGLYMADAAESGADWNAEAAFPGCGFDAVSLGFAPDMGSDGEYDALEISAAESGVLLGGDILPGATGTGPDFFLAARAVRDYPGLYMMAEAPQTLWPLLPPPAEAERGEGIAGTPLSPDSVAALAASGVIPPAFSRDADPALGGGWAVTPEVAGVDGVNRRWLYRRAGPENESSRRPVLNWDDPSGAARRVLSASVIRQVGMLHQPLVGLSVADLWGQDPAAPSENRISPEPALSALRALSRDVRRYGAWSLLRDDLPAAIIPELQAAGPDFVRDSITSPALEYALLTGDAAPLTRALEASLAAGVDHSGLWRAPADGSPLAFEAAGLSSRDATAGLSGAWKELMTTSRGVSADALTLAAAASGMEPSGIAKLRQILRLDSFEGHGKNAARSAAAPEAALLRLRDAHILQIAFRALQPGLLMVTGQDLTGALATPEERIPGTAPSWIMDGSATPFTSRGLPAVPGLYPPPEVQGRQPDSFGGQLAALAALRRETGVAAGRLVAVAALDHPSVAGVLTLLPDGDGLLCVGNFSDEELTARARLPEGLIRAGEEGQDLRSGERVTMDRDRPILHMKPWQCRAIRLKGSPS